MVLSRARRIGLPVLRRINPGDITIRHHWTGRRFVLHSYRHKGYWYHRGNRELDTMLMSARLLGPGNVVVEVGGHIGYLSEFFAEMVGSHGSVDVFEPDPANASYLRRNLVGRPNCVLRGLAISDEPGKADFWVEDMTGQNNSLIKDYSALTDNARAAGTTPTIRRITVQPETLDNVYGHAQRMDFLKIDVEGAEDQVVAGGRATISRLKPVILIEITRNREEVVGALTEMGYLLVEPNGLPVTEGAIRDPNCFALHIDAHRRVIEGLGLVTS